MKLFIILACVYLHVATIEATPRIIGGQPARVGQFPYNAGLEITTETSRLFCSGALINDEWILTAAQCIEKATSVTIKLGSIHRSASDSNRVTLASSHFVIHPNFDLRTIENDIGLIRLRQPIEYTDYIRPILLANSQLPPNASIRGQVLGWGQISDSISDLSDSLNYVQVSSLSTDECKLTYGNQVNENMICMEGNLNEGTCIGDIGSPLVIPLVGGSALHFGVASFLSGNGCESTDPSGFTKTFAYVDWINSITEL